MISIIARDSSGEYPNREWIYSVSLSPARTVDVKVLEKTGLMYIMQNEDGSTVYNQKESCPGYGYDEEEVIALVRDTYLREDAPPAVLADVCKRLSGPKSFQEQLDNLMEIPSPAPRHGHCGHRMVKGADGYYYCKHCEDLARAESDPYSSTARTNRIKGTSSLFYDDAWEQECRTRRENQHLLGEITYEGK